MSILLSAYFAEGIVFSADRNATVIAGSVVDVEPGSLTKVVAWPQERAVVGFCGLACLENLSMVEWLRIFIAAHRDFRSLDDLAGGLRKSVEDAFGHDYPPGVPVTLSQSLVIHLGGFKVVGGYWVPSMYHIHNYYQRFTPAAYADRHFECSEDVEREFRSWGSADYPGRTRDRLREMMVDRDHFLWFNNGYDLRIFNGIKAHMWHLLQGLRRDGVLPATPTLENWEAYCRMAVEMYGVFFREHYLPQARYVGGGVDSVTIPWPEIPPPSGSGST